MAPVIFMARYWNSCGVYSHSRAGLCNSDCYRRSGWLILTLASCHALFWIMCCGGGQPPCNEQASGEAHTGRPPNSHVTESSWNGSSSLFLVQSHGRLWVRPPFLPCWATPGLSPIESVHKTTNVCFCFQLLYIGDNLPHRKVDNEYMMAVILLFSNYYMKQSIS